MGILDLFKKRSISALPESSSLNPEEQYFATDSAETGQNPFGFTPNASNPQLNPPKAQVQKEIISPPNFSGFPDLNKKVQSKPIIQDPFSNRSFGNPSLDRPPVPPISATVDPFRPKSSFGMANDSDYSISFTQKENLAPQPIRQAPQRFPTLQVRETVPSVEEKPAPKAFLFRAAEPLAENNFEKDESNLPEFSDEDVSPFEDEVHPIGHQYSYDEEVFLPKKHVFISLKDHHDLIASFGQIIAKLDSHQKSIDRVEYLIDAKESIHAKLKAEVEDVQRKLVLVDKVLFEDNPYFNSY